MARHAWQILANPSVTDLQEPQHSTNRYIPHNLINKEERKKRNGLKITDRYSGKTKMKHLSSIANDVVGRCAAKAGTSVEKLVNEFESGWRPDSSDYSRQFVEFCSAKAVCAMCQNVGDNFSDGSFSRLTFDMMLAREMPSAAEEEAKLECVGKGKEDRKRVVNPPQENDEVGLFFSDVMPLLVDHEADTGEDSFLWLASLFPLVADVVNARFTFETLTATIGNRLHFPAYDKYLKEIDKCIKHLQKQDTPKGVQLADGEFILHVEGTASSQRVVRHIGGTSWPGRITLTNYAVYFEASSVVSYEDAVKIDLSKDNGLTAKTAATGPWGAPLFDKAILYESPDLSEGIILEFPELTSSTRRDHWLALTKEIMLMHSFLSKFKIEAPSHAWEMHSRTILSIVRLHAAREMLRMTPPLPTKFLIFALYEDLPKGDYVLEELALSLKQDHEKVPCCASSILKSVNMVVSIEPEVKEEKEKEEYVSSSTASARESNVSLDTAITQVREEAREVEVAKATAAGLKEEGISDSVAVLLELLEPLKGVPPRVREIVTWERPRVTVVVLTAATVVIYKEWVNKAIAASLLWLVVKMFQARARETRHKRDEVVVSATSEQSTMESIVSAQRGLQSLHELIQTTNITLLKLQSIFASRTRKHADMVMLGLIAVAVMLSIIPLKFIFLGTIVYFFVMNSSLGKYMENDRGNRRWKEWWDSIPVVPVRVDDKAK